MIHKKDAKEIINRMTMAKDVHKLSQLSPRFSL